MAYQKRLPNFVNLMRFTRKPSVSNKLSGRAFLLEFHKLKPFQPQVRAQAGSLKITFCTVILANTIQHLINIRFAP